MEKQLIAIYGGSRDVIVPRITQQCGSKDCGLLAIAYAWLGEKPEVVVFQQKVIREHLMSCFNSFELRPFPYTQRNAKRIEFDNHKI